MIGRINIGIPKQVFGVKLPNEKQVGAGAGAGAGAAVETGLQKTTNFASLKVCTDRKRRNGQIKTEVLQTRLE